MYQVQTIIKLGSDQTGLTLSYKLVDSTGTPVGTTVSTGFVEMGAGEYSLLAQLPDNFRGCIQIYNGSTYVTSGAINPEEIETPGRTLRVVQA